MILTMAWKEMREHQGIWLTMVFMSVGLGLGLSKIVALGDANLAAPVAALTFLGLAATYGVVCGAMMFAGEHEGGTLVFLDIFLGRRGLLWMGKFAIGAVLVMTQALAVAAVLGLLKQEMPHWVTAIVGRAFAVPRAGIAPQTSVYWLLILPVVTLEAFAWGLLGSSLTKRVLTGAALAALFFTPVLLFALLAPAEIFFGIRLVLATICLAISCAIFLGQAREATRETPIAPSGQFDVKEEFLDRWAKYERDDDFTDDRSVSVPASSPAHAPSISTSNGERAPYFEHGPFADGADDDEPAQPQSPSAALWWLTFQQAWPVVCMLGGVGLLIGFVIPANAQVLWPLATLLLGVACGTAAFAPEQRDLSYQFLAAQHFPLKAIWRFKIVFWLAVAMLLAIVMLLGAILSITVALLQRQGQLAPGIGFQGTLHDLMGPILFFGVWLIYGFCSAQIVVWYCRKSILALLVSSLVAMAAVGLWLPSLLCGGMSGWQLWVAPLTTLLATWCLMRAWAGGRIWERKPVAALIGFVTLAIVWASLWFGTRAWIIPDVGEPLDPIAFKATLPEGITAAKAIHGAITKLDAANDEWLEPLAEITRLPIGVLEYPSTTGNLPGLQHLPTCGILTDRLLRKARESEPDAAFEHLAQVLALSRNLRNKAPLESYLAGVHHEESALKELDKLLARGKPTSKLLRGILDELNRHAKETPPPLDCLQTECYRSIGVVDNPIFWTLAAPDGRRIPERWLVGGIAVSLEAPWESERKMRLWQLVWAGLFRGIETSHWKLPIETEEFRTEKTATRTILQGWLPAPESSVTRAYTARLLDASWLADERLFCSVTRLRNAATRARYRVDATRQAIAVALYRMDDGKSPSELQILVPKYLASLPTDPYSGELYRYRIAPQNGQATLWSTGPDAKDHGGLNHGGHLPDDDPRWPGGDFDLILLEPCWP
jgi:hypothetical protein